MIYNLEIKMGKENVMKINNPVFIILISIIFYLFCFSCGGPGATGAVAPSNVTASRNGEDIHVSWSSVAGADSYRVYRRENNGPFTGISGDIPMTTYTDSACPKDAVIAYTVRSVAGSKESLSAPASNSVAAWVQNINISKLYYADRISLSWDIHPEDPEEFRVYRYESGASIVPQKTYTGILNNFFDDVYDAASNPIVEEDMYYYRVTWVDHGIEYGNDSPLEFGLYSSRIDENEPNETADNAVSLGLNLSASASIIYSYGTAVGSNDEDIDWYRYSGTAGEAFYVNVDIPADADSKDFTPGELYIRFFYNDAYIGPGQIVNPGSNVFLFDDFQGATGPVDVFFEIYTSVATIKDVIDQYEISVTDEL
jgi:fibronectin type 3 domain-containing protein